MSERFVAHWFRRDLRIDDNAGLYHALKSGLPVIPVFIFDTEILNKLSDSKDLRVNFIHQKLNNLKEELRKLGSDLAIYYGNPVELWPKIVEEYNIKCVYTNRDYEQHAIDRDKKVEERIKSLGAEFKSYKDHVIFEYDEVLKDDGLPYTVFTPYSKKWKLKLNDFYLKPYPSEKYTNGLHKFNAGEMISLEAMGFETVQRKFPEATVKSSLIANYHNTRDFPAIEGTSKLSLHFRFGTVSIRDKVKKALSISEKFLNELIWRDFYIQIMAHFPHAMHSAFKPAYDKIEWRNNETEFNAWCEGKTGYPIVDAGMRELNTTGHMHNRVRMIVASFLCKHLLIDWKWGEAYFAEKLLDFEQASNNGGWQWAAGSGVDAAPYFRIFNPYLQTEKFDPERIYIKRWIPEFGTKDYPKEIVKHEEARKRCLEVYKEGMNGPI